MTVKLAKIAYNQKGAFLMQTIMSSKIENRKEFGGSTKDFILFMGILVTQFLALYIAVIKSYKNEKNRNAQ